MKLMGKKVYIFVLIYTSLYVLVNSMQDMWNSTEFTRNSMEFRRGHVDSDHVVPKMEIKAKFRTEVENSARNFVEVFKKCNFGCNSVQTPCGIHGGQ